MVELVHDQFQWHARLAGLVAPGLAQGVRAKVADQPDRTTHFGNHPPGLDTSQWPIVLRATAFAGKKDVVARLVSGTWVGGLIFFQGIAHTGIDDHDVALVALFFANLKLLSNRPRLIKKITDAQLQEIRDTQGAIDADRKKEWIAKRFGPFQ